MRYRMIPLLATGLASLSLTACGSRLVVIEQCPAIPVALTEPCQPPARALDTNGDLARAYLDAVECVDESSLKLRAIRELAACRLQTETRRGTRPTR